MRKHSHLSGNILDSIVLQVIYETIQRQLIVLIPINYHNQHYVIAKLFTNRLNSYEKMYIYREL